MNSIIGDLSLVYKLKKIIYQLDELELLFLDPGGRPLLAGPLLDEDELDPPPDTFDS